MRVFSSSGSPCDCTCQALLEERPAASGLCEQGRLEENNLVSILLLRCAKRLDRHLGHHFDEQFSLSQRKGQHAHGHPVTNRCCKSPQHPGVRRVWRLAHLTDPVAIVQWRLHQRHNCKGQRHAWCNSETSCSEWLPSGALSAMVLSVRERSRRQRSLLRLPGSSCRQNGHNNVQKKCKTSANRRKKAQTSANSKNATNRR